METFRDRLEFLFGKDAGPTKISKEIGMAYAGFSRVWYDGGIPKAETLLKIKEVTNCNLDWLLTGEGEPFPAPPQEMSLADNLARTGERGEVHPQEAVEEKVSLSDRFGLWLSFYPFSQEDYLAAAESWLTDAGLSLDDTARRAALQWAQMRGSRSGRTAYQFACDWAGRLPHEREVD